MRHWLRQLQQRTSVRLKNRQAWQAERKRGHGDWILWKGLIGFSIPMALLVHATLWIVFGRSAAWSSSFGINVVVILWWVLGGYVAADVIWHQMEGRYGSGSDETV